MTAPRPPDRDGGQVDALVADRYLDALLAAADRRAVDSPADPGLDAELREAARILRRSLVRVHPSFRFEERLARRLADLAAGRSHPGLAAAGGGALISFPAIGALPAAAAAGLPSGSLGPGSAGPGSAAAADPLLAAILAGDLDPTDEAALERAAPGAFDRRPLLVGGAALTSAALSLVGVAIVAWRASRPGSRHGSGSVMTRAARSAHARRATAAAGAGLSGGPA